MWLRMMIITILLNKIYTNINVIADIFETNAFRLQHSPGYKYSSYQTRNLSLWMRR